MTTSNAINMQNVITHDAFVSNLDRFLEDVANETGSRHSADCNMLQFSLCIGAGVGPKSYTDGLPPRMKFKVSRNNTYYTIVEVDDSGFGSNETQRMLNYLNNKYGAKTARSTDMMYVKGRNPRFEVKSQALHDELEMAKNYQKIFHGSLIGGVNMFMHLPIREETKQLLRQPGVTVELLPRPEKGEGWHEIFIDGLDSSLEQQVATEIFAAMEQYYGEGSIVQ